MCAKKRQLSSFSLALLWLENLTTRSKCFFIFSCDSCRGASICGQIYETFIKLSCWALQSSPLRYQCEKTKLLESVARPASQQRADEKDDIFLLLLIHIYCVRHLDDAFNNIVQNVHKKLFMVKFQT